MKMYPITACVLNFRLRSPCSSGLHDVSMVSRQGAIERRLMLCGFGGLWCCPASQYSPNRPEAAD